MPCQRRGARAASSLAARSRRRNPEAALFRRGWPAFGKPCRYSLRPNAEQAGNTRKCRRGKKSPEFGPRNDAQNDAEAPPPDSRASPGDRIATSRRESGYGGDPMEPPPEPSIQRSRSTRCWRRNWLGATCGALWTKGGPGRASVASDFWLICSNPRGTCTDGCRAESGIRTKEG